MSVLLKGVVAILVRELAAALGRYLAGRRTEAAAREAGRLEAERSAALAAAERAEAIAAVPEPQDDEVLRRLRNGSA
jgi:hypothetical protein